MNPKPLNPKPLPCESKQCVCVCAGGGLYVYVYVYVCVCVCVCMRDTVFVCTYGVCACVRKKKHVLEGVSGNHVMVSFTRLQNPLLPISAVRV
jgi:hypothetical protein